MPKKDPVDSKLPYFSKSKKQQKQMKSIKDKQRAPAGKMGTTIKKGSGKGKTKR